MLGRPPRAAVPGAGGAPEADRPHTTGVHVIAATQLKVGMIIMHNGKPHRVTNVLHVTPGNWRGMVQTRLVNIETGSNTEHRFRSEDKVEKANMEQHSLQFSYRAADSFHFMNTESYEMIDLPADVLGDAVHYLVDGMVITADYFSGRVVGIEVPMFVELNVTETTPNIKGAAVQNTSKPAILETGYEIKVPPYIEVGNRVKIDTRTGEFVERV
jgi:elongation factor P